LITRQTRLQLIVFAVIALAGLTFTGARYAGLSKYFVNEGYVVAADFADSGGIFQGAEVTYRGVPVGKVEALELIDTGVRAQLKLKTGTEVPAGGRAIVSNRSAVGEQYVDLQPRRQGEPFMTDGDVIPQADTAIPIQPTQLLTNLSRFVNSLDTKDVRVVLEELGNAFEDSGQDLQRLVDAGDLLTRAASDALPQTLKLIDDGRTVLDTQRDVSGQFRSYTRDLRSLTGQLRASDPDFRSLFKNGTDSAVVTTDLLESNRSDLPILLSNLVTVAQVQKVRIPALRQILVTYPNVVAGGFTVTPGDGTAHFGTATTTTPGVCTQGYSDDQRDFSDTRTIAQVRKSDPARAAELERRNNTAYCAESEPVGVRGAQHAPRPNGLAPFGEGADSGGGSSAAATSTTPSSSGGTSSTSSTEGTSSASSATEAEPLVGADQLSNGRVMDGSGRTFSVGDSAGAASVFGSSSWQWLLVGPLSQR